MDCGHDSGLDMVGDVTQDDTVRQRTRHVVRNRDPQPTLDVLKEEHMFGDTDFRDLHQTVYQFSFHFSLKCIMKLTVLSCAM